MTQFEIIQAARKANLNRFGSQSQCRLVGYGWRVQTPDAGTNLSNGTQTQETSRLRYKAIGNISDIAVMFANGSAPFSTVRTAGDAITITASIEYTAVNAAGTSTPNTIIPLTFNNGATSVLLAWNRNLLSDSLAIEIPDGTDYWVRTCVTVTAGQKWYKWLATNITYNEGIVSGSDQTLSGTITNSTGYTYGPTAMVGTSTSRLGAVFLNGDSISVGTNTDTGYATLGFGIGGGIFGRAFSNTFPQFMGNRNSDQCSYWQPQCRPYLAPLFGMCDFFIDQLGMNDFPAITLAQMQINAITMWDTHLSRGVLGYRTTITPKTTSTDAFITTANQTVTANESRRTGFNDWIRDGAPIHATTRAAQAIGATGATVIRMGQPGHALLGYFETADVAETTRNSGIWKVNGGTAYTSDGTHPVAAMYILLGAAIDTTKFYLW